MNNIVLQKYEIFLRPCNISLQKIMLYQNSIKDFLVNKPSMGLHMTIFGFYSSKDLEDTISDYLDDAVIVHNPVQTLGVAQYGDSIAIMLEKTEYISRLHNQMLSIFKPEIIFKDGGLSMNDVPELFKEKYPYVGDNYSPHISIGKINKYVPEFLDKYIDVGINQVGFSNLIAAVKDDHELRYIGEKIFNK